MYCNNSDEMFSDSYVIGAMAISNKIHYHYIFLFIEMIVILFNNKNINYNNIIKLMGCIAHGCISE